MPHSAERVVLTLLAAAQILLLLTLQPAISNALLCAHSMIVFNRSNKEDEQAGFSPGELIVGLGNETKAALQTWIAKWNGVILEELPEIHVFLVKVNEQSANVMEQDGILRTSFDYVEPNYYVHWALAPNDPLWPSQWALSKVRADSAWNIEVGKQSVVVAVLDTGIDYSHEDLAGNYVPMGYDWVNHDPDPMDDSSNGHGTHVAGIIGALTGNGLGIAGIAQVSIMGEKVLNSFGMGTVFDVAEGVVHSAQQGARITINSYGTYQFSQTMRDVFGYASQQGVLNFAAAGNGNTDKPFYPAAFGDFVVSVAGTDQYDAKASFSNYGDWIEVAAPAVNIVSTLPHNSYGPLGGTSMACPIAAAAAALVWSHFMSFSQEQVRGRLQQTAIDLGMPGRDPVFGYGRIDLFSALKMSTSTPVGGTVEQPNVRNLLTVWVGVALVAVCVGSLPMLLGRAHRNAKGERSAREYE